MRTYNIPSYYRNLKIYIYICHKHIFMVPKVFEPLKFYCSYHVCLPKLLYVIVTTVCLPNYFITLCNSYHGLSA